MNGAQACCAMDGVEIWSKGRHNLKMRERRGVKKGQNDCKNETNDKAPAGHPNTKLFLGGRLHAALKPHFTRSGWAGATCGWTSNGALGLPLHIL